jgi:hypothetical protein
LQLADHLDSVNAAAELGTTRPSLRKAFVRHGLACRPATPKRSGSAPWLRPAARAGQPATPGLDPVFVALNPGALPIRERSEAELYQWVRREEQYATLGANVVVS